MGTTHLAAMRTAFDKMCGGSITSGLEIPRRRQHLPIVLSGKEVVRLLEAAPSLRDKLLLGLLYAGGLRVSEVVRLRWQDVDFDRKQLRIVAGKGRKDRMALLPQSLAESRTATVMTTTNSPSWQSAWRNPSQTPRGRLLLLIASS